MFETSGIICPPIFEGYYSSIFAFFTTKGFMQDPLVYIQENISKGASLFMPLQRHTDIIIYAAASSLGATVTADSVITGDRNLFIGIQTADCVPLLIYDPHTSLVACVHAGWRGTAQGIVSKTLTGIRREFGASLDNLLIAIGPSIGECCYEVGQDVALKVVEASGGGECMSMRDGKYYLNLQRANAAQALKSGIKAENLWICQECTHCQPEKYHSYRYNKAKDKGLRQYAIIGNL